jgi:hypothetical protein
MYMTCRPVSLFVYFAQYSGHHLLLSRCASVCLSNLNRLYFLSLKWAHLSAVENSHVNSYLFSTCIATATGVAMAELGMVQQLQKELRAKAMLALSSIFCKALEQQRQQQQ